MPLKDREQRRAYSRISGVAYRAAHRDEIRAYLVAHRKKILAYHHAYYVAHREERRTRDAAYYAAHRDEIRANRAAYFAAYRDANREDVRAAQRKWQAAHPEMAAVYQNRRRVRKIGNGGSHTIQEWRDKCALFANLCAYCGESRPLHRDHNIPLTRGGSDDITNILPACRPCNSRKHSLTAREFLDLRTAALVA